MRTALAIAMLAAACGGSTPAPAPPSPGNAATGEAAPAPAPEPAPRASPYKAATWIARLGDPREQERAITELEALGDPSAIEPIAALWEPQRRSARILAVVIGLARPLTPAEAKAAFLVDYEVAGRPASWDKALPILIRAVTDLDESDPRAVDSATRAAAALGEAELGLEALVALATRPATRRLRQAQIAAIREIGGFAGDHATAGAALLAVLARDQPPRPQAATGDRPAAEEAYTSYVLTTGAAINALGKLRVPSAAGPLVLAMYRTPELFMQARRALVATGPTAEAALRKALRGKSAEVNRLFAANRLGTYCGDDGKATCVPVSAREFYAAVVLGDFHDPAVVPELLAVLKRPATPAYYVDGQAAPTTQYHAVFDALRTIGAPAAAARVRALWSAKQTDVVTRTLAVATYPFVARDQAGLAALATIAGDNAADDGLRQEAATAFARLAVATKDIAVLQPLVQRYVDAAAKHTDATHVAAYLAFARMFQIHMARIEVAARCKSDPACLAASLSLSVEDAVANNTPHITDVATWSAEDKRELAIAAADRALLELGKLGAKASGQTDAVLAAAGSTDRQVRTAALLALPKIAKVPCEPCVTALDAVVHPGAGKKVIADLDYETTILLDYFTWAGGRGAK